MSVERPAIQPIESDFQFQYLSTEELDRMQEATLQIMEEVGVKFPSEKALGIFGDHGAHVDHDTQIVKIPSGLVF
jgi:trimethylamine--corrinoid protein Co-methyltransferase